MGVKSTGSFPTTTKADGHLVEYYRNSFVAGGGANSGPTVGSMNASGGTTFTPGDGYKYHVFTSSSSPGFAVSVAGPGEVEYVIVGGGGGGGRRTGGGGGAGGFRSGSSTGLTATAYPIVVGAGGVGAPYPGSNPLTGRVGGHSIFNSVRSEGGGGGKGFAGTPLPNEFNGASGGGGAYPTPTQAGGTGNREAGTDTPVPSQGNPGGTGGLDGPGMYPSWGGGGGGAGAAGSNGTPGTNAAGGAGGVGKSVGAAPIDFTIPTDYGTPGPAPGRWFAGGGGGGGSRLPGTGATGGAGGAGGGAAGNPDNVPTQAAAATVNTGGGGGGGSIHPPGGEDARDGGGAGGSGIVIIRYQV